MTAAALGASLLLSYSPAQAAVPAYVKTWGAPLNVRSGPSIDADIVGSLPNGTPVTVLCQTYNDDKWIDGPYRPSRLWDKIGEGRWVADALVYTGSMDPVTSLCDRSRPNPPEVGVGETRPAEEPPVGGLRPAPAAGGAVG